MNEQKINEIFSFLLDAAKNTQTFALEQAPLLCKEIIQYGIVSHAIRSFISIVILIITIVYIYKVIIPMTKQERSFFDDGLLIRQLIAGIVLFIALISFCCSLQSLAKVAVAPRLYLLQEIKRMM